MLIVTNDTQTFNVPIFRSPFVDNTLVMRLHNKTTNEDVVIYPDSCEIHTTYVTITADLSNLYGGEWEYRLTNTDEDGYVIVASQGTMYVNQLARFTDANGERTYSTRESVRGGVCPPCPPCPNTYSINVTVDLEMASVAGSCDSVEENAAIYIGCVPRSGYRFSQWSDGNNENPRRVVADGNKTYTAICEAVSPTPTTTTHTISVTADEHSTAIGGGTYEENTTASIGIIVAKGYRFVSWSDGNIENPRQVVVDADKNYTAVVEQIPTYNVTASGFSYGEGSVLGLGTFTEGSKTTVGYCSKRTNRIVQHYVSWVALFRNGKLVQSGGISLPYTIENIDADYHFDIFDRYVRGAKVSIKLVDINGDEIGDIVSADCDYYSDYHYNDGDDSDYAYGVLNCMKEGYKFLRWSDGNTDNPRTVTKSMLHSGAGGDFTAIMERVQEGGNKRVNIDSNEALDIFCPQREGTIGSVLPWRVKKARPFTIVDFDASYNQMYNGGGVNDTAIWSINNYQDGNPWQGLIMLSEDDSRNIIKYNVREYPGADFGNVFTPSVSNTTFTSIVGQESSSHYNTTYLEFSNMWSAIDYNEITNKFFEPIIDGGQRSGQGVNYTWISNAQAYNSGFGTNWNCINFANYSNGQYMTQKYGECYTKRQGDELIVEYRNGDNDIAQWHIGITSDYVYVVFSNWVSSLNNIWFNDGTGHFKYVDSNMQIVECKDEYGNDFYPWNRIDITCQLTSTPTDGMVIRMDVVPNEPKRLDIEVAYSDRVTFYENFQNVCQPYSNNSEGFTVGDKYINETTGVNFYEFVGDRLPMVSRNAPYLSKYEVKSVMPDITMLQDDFMSGARLNDYSWLFDKLPNISTIENTVFGSSDIRTFEPTAGQWSQLTTIGNHFLFYSMVERVDFTNLTNLTTVHQSLCSNCSNLVYANISKLKDLTEYDNSGWFQSCPNLRDIVFDGTTTQYQNQLGSLGYFEYRSSCTLHVDSAYLQDYIDMYGGEWMSIVAI